MQRKCENFEVLSFLGYHITKINSSDRPKKSVEEPWIIDHKMKTALSGRTSQAILESRYIGQQRMLKQRKFE